MRWKHQRRLPGWLAPGSPLIEAAGVSVMIEGHRILQNIDLRVQAGELVAVVGPNGAGKSTLFAALTGDITLAEGRVLLHGQPAASWSQSEQALRRAVLPQQIAVSFPFLVADIVGMGRAPWSGTPAEDEDESIVAAAMQATESAHLGGRQFPSLSGGERARVALARVLAQSSQLLLLDEPTAALDLHHQEVVLSTLRRHASEGAGIVVVLHDLGLAAAHADRIVLMHRSRIVADASPPEVFTPELLSTVYEHPIEILPHPRTAQPLVLPLR